MSIYISPDKEYPRFQGDIKLANPKWNVGEDLPDGWVEVLETPMPTAGIDEVVEEGAPTSKGDKWYRTWNVRPLNEKEKERLEAPKTAKAKLIALGLTEAEIDALRIGLVR